MKNLITLVYIILAGFCHTAVFGQKILYNSDKIPKCYWLAVGVGGSSLGTISVDFELNAEISNRWFIAVNGVGESSSFLFSSSIHDANVNTFSVSTGKIFKQKYSFVTVSAGLGFVQVHTTDYSSSGLFGSINNEKNQNTIGIPISINGHLVALQAFGLGIGGYINLNPVQTTAGFQVKLSFGRLATHEEKVKH